MESLFLDTNRCDSREGRQQEQRPPATGRAVSDRELTAAFVRRNLSRCLTALCQCFLFLESHQLSYRGSTMAKKAKAGFIMSQEIRKLLRKKRSLTGGRRSPGFPARTRPGRRGENRDKSDFAGPNRPSAACNHPVRARAKNYHTGCCLTRC